LLPVKNGGNNSLYHAYQESNGRVKAVVISSPSDVRLFAKEKKGSHVAFVWVQVTFGAIVSVENVPGSMKVMD
jgi:hypothetical protein